MVNRFTLPNGIRIVHQELPGSKIVNMSVDIEHGSMHDSENETGLTSLAIKALPGGSKTRSRKEISSAIESKGGDFNVSSGLQTSDISATSLPRETEDTFSIIVDCLLNPAYKAVEVKQTKAQTIQRIKQREQNPARLMGKNFIGAAYFGPAGKSSDGTEKDVKTFTVAQIKKKHKEIFSRPENMVVSFTGDIDFEKVKDLSDKYLGHLKASGKEQKQAPVSFAGKDTRVDTAGQQINIAIGFPAPGKNDLEKYDAKMLIQLIDGGMSSPLFVEVREKRSLVYSVNAAYTGIEDQGLIYIQAGTSPERTEELLSVSLDVLANAAKTKYTEDELAIARKGLLNQAKIRMENSSAIRDKNAYDIINFDSVETLDEYEAHLKNVTSDDINRMAYSLMKSDSYALSAVGKTEHVPSPKEIKALIADKIKDITVPEKTAKNKTDLKVSFDGAKDQNLTISKAPQLTTLANGLQIVTVERPGSVACGAWVGAGSDHETPALNGATHMNEHMMIIRGTPSYASGMLQKTIEDMGGELNAYTDNDRTAYYFYNISPESLAETMKICGEVVFEANIFEEEFTGKTITLPDGSEMKTKGERVVVLEEIKRALDNANNLKWYQINKLAYGDQAHAEPVLGTAESLLNMTAADLRAYRDEYYSSNNVVFVAVGPVKHENFVKMIDDLHGDRKPSNFPPLPVPIYYGGTTALEKEGHQTCDLALCAEGIAKTDALSPAYDVMSCILSGGYSSRLDIKLVNDLELTTSIGSAPLAYRNKGLYGTFLSAEPKNIKPAIQAVYSEYRRLLTDLTESELKQAKNMLELQLIKEEETSRNACRIYGEDVLANKAVKTRDEKLEALKNVTIDDVKTAMRAVLASNPTLSMVIPQGLDKKFVPDHTDVCNMRDNTGGAPRNIHGAKPRNLSP